jgi:DNA adenine methylase
MDIINCNRNVFSIWINDKDPGVTALWTSVMKYPEQLKSLVKAFKPSSNVFLEYRDILINNTIATSDIVVIGFMKLVVHQLSYSGLGTKAGTTESKNKIDSRWSQAAICRKIDNINGKFSKLYIPNKECTAFDFEPLLDQYKKNCVIYLDPPPYKKGNSLYQYGFSIDDHQRLAESVRKTKNRWLLSYDNCPEVKELYKGFKIEEISEEGKKNKSDLIISL